MRSSRSDSIDSTQTRASPSRTKSWTDSPVCSCSHARAGRAAAHTGTASAASCPSADQPQPEAEAAVVVPPHEAVVLERDGEAVGGGPGQARALDQLGQRGRAGPRARRARPSPCRARPRRLHCPHSETSISHSKTQGRPMTARTLSEKVWDRHLVRSTPGEPDLLYIDLHLSTRSPARRPSTASASRAAGSAAPSSPSPRPTTTSPPRTSTSRWPTRSPPSSSRCSRPTPPSSASPTTGWATRTRASSTSSAPSRAARCRA